MRIGIIGPWRSMRGDLIEEENRLIAQALSEMGHHVTPLPGLSGTLTQITQFLKKDNPVQIVIDSILGARLERQLFPYESLIVSAPNVNHESIARAMGNRSVLIWERGGCTSEDCGEMPNATFICDCEERVKRTKQRGRRAVLVEHAARGNKTALKKRLKQALEASAKAVESP